VLTFNPHPVQILYPERQLKRLLPREDLVEQLPRYGVDLLLELPFTRDFAAQSAVEFLDRFVGDVLRPKAVVAGYDFGFGRAREGNLDDLRTWCQSREAALHVVPPLERDGGIISSRRLRTLIEAGDVAAARTLMGRAFYLRGRVGAGAGRGRTIGTPTLNQDVVNETLPARGVYATRARLRGDVTSFASVTNIGVNPTFEGLTVKVETHVLDADVAWREREVDIDFLEYLRPEQKFSGIDELRDQIARDVARAREVNA